MRKFIPKEKLSKKARKELDAKERRTWGNINPATRKTANEKAYNRKKVRIRPEDFLPGPFVYFKLIFGYKMDESAKHIKI